VIPKQAPLETNSIHTESDAVQGLEQLITAFLVSRFLESCQHIAARGCGRAEPAAREE
jgi:hypothetical protein